MISRRDFLKLSSLVGVARSFPAFAQELAAPDYKIDIAPVTLDLSPRHKLKTIAYNGQVPGALLRLKENQPVTIEVANRTDRPEVVHWHAALIASPIESHSVGIGAFTQKITYATTVYPSLALAMHRRKQQLALRF